MKRRVYAMAMERSEAVSRSTGLGIRFVQHYIKCFLAKDTADRAVIPHWLGEMYAWYATVATIKLKPRGMYLSNKQMEGWFFDNGIEQDPNSMLDINPRIAGVEDYNVWDMNELTELCVGYWQFVEKVLASEHLTEEGMMRILKDCL